MEIIEEWRLFNLLKQYECLCCELTTIFTQKEISLTEKDKLIIDGIGDIATVAQNAMTFRPLPAT